MNAPSAATTNGRLRQRLTESIFRKGLRRTLLFWFLVISLTPLTIVSFVTFSNTHRALRNAAEAKLTAIADLKAHQIQDFFRRCFSELAVQSSRRLTHEMATDLRGAFKTSRMELSDFVRTPQWSSLAGGYDKHCRLFLSSQAIFDFLVIDFEGNLLYTARRERDLGTNLFTGRYADTLLAKSCRVVLKEGQPVLSDFERYAPSDNQPFCFVVAPIPGKNGTSAGMLALQIPCSSTDGIMHEKTGLGETGELYLVGDDLRMRSNSVLDDQHTMLGREIVTEQTRLWRKEHFSDRLSPGMEEKVFTYAGPRGRPVIGFHRDLDLAGVPMAIIAEVETSKAFESATVQRNIALALFAFTTVLVITAAFTLAGRLANPIVRLSAWGRRVSQGDLSYEEVSESKDEIGQMSRSFADVVSSFREITEVSKAVAVGDFSRSVKVRSEEDALGKAVNQMAANLRSVVRQANAIAAGDYSAEISPRSDGDDLGIALNRMTRQLREGTEKNEKALEEARALVGYLDSIPAPVMTMDLGFTITYINPAGAAMVGLSQDECVGMKCYELYGNPDCRTGACSLAQAIQGGQCTSRETVLEFKGKKLPVQYTGVPLRNPEGSVSGAMEFIIDISRIYEVMESIRDESWLRAGETELNEKVRGEQSVAELCGNVITFLAGYLKAKVGAIYVTSGGNKQALTLMGTYGDAQYHDLSNEGGFLEGRPSPGLIGQAVAAKTRMLITDVPEGYMKIRSGLGEADPHMIAIVPFMYEGQLEGVIELGTFGRFTDLQLTFLDRAADDIAIAKAVTDSRVRMHELLTETQNQAEELQSQQEELRQANEELEEQTSILEEQKKDVQEKNVELRKAREVIEEKARALEAASRYKSEFVANMSHELRTPLNSILLLSKLLSDNRDGNLTEKQQESARIVHSSGSDLLNLINGILDLSKVEAGKMEVHPERVDLRDFAKGLEMDFGVVSQQRGLSLTIDLAEDLPPYILTDKQKAAQIVKNLLSNAFKFTSQGGVKLSICRPGASGRLPGSGMSPETAIAISVSDTGEGIPQDKKDLIFEAFQQADGTTSRKYGGTGLGLSISRQYSRLLRGEIHVESEQGKGSTFTLYLPESFESVDNAAGSLAEKAAEQGPASSEAGQKEPKRQPGLPTTDPANSPTDAGYIPDDRSHLSPGDKSVLVIEDDAPFATILRDLSREKGFKVLMAGDGETGLYLADYYRPSAIILDIGLPGMDGWAVMARLKDNPDTRHIPVHFVSALEKKLDAMKMGAIGYLTKPVSMDNLEDTFASIENAISRPMKQLLVVESDEAQQRKISDLVGNGDVTITAVFTGQDALDQLKSRGLDCIILDPALPDMPGSEFLRRLLADDELPQVPIIIYTGKALTDEEEMTIRQYADEIVIRGAKSPERLLDDITLFLHRTEAGLPEDKQRILRMIHDKESILKDKKVLVVDDDMRNVYALTNILENKGIIVRAAKDGKEALKSLDENSDVDLVLMDIMMPDMDGYEATKRIRKLSKFKQLPIIALTAKAMKGDKMKCIEAGANDYLAKPVDSERLLSMLRVWLY